MFIIFQEIRFAVEGFVGAAFLSLRSGVTSSSPLRGTYKGKNRTSQPHSDEEDILKTFH